MQTIIVHLDGDATVARTWIDGETIARDVSAAGSIQCALDRIASEGGGRLQIEPGVFELDHELTVPSRTVMTGSGPATRLQASETNPSGA